MDPQDFAPLQGPRSLEESFKEKKADFIAIY